MRALDDYTYEVDGVSHPDFLDRRDPATHKGHYGHALLVAGSYGKMGAAVLAARACLRSGVGLLTVHVPRKGVDVMQVSVPEAMVSVDECDEHFSALPVSLDRYDAVAVGPGLGTHPDTRRALVELITQMPSRVRLILDADALNIVSMEWRCAESHLTLPPDTILTPHAREFERLFGPFLSEEQRYATQRMAAKTRSLVLLHKGHRSRVCAPDGSVYINTTGNAGMATAGSGDVLTGIMLAFSSQEGISAVTAAVCAVYFHGKAADEAVKKQSQSSLVASDIVENLKLVLRDNH